jgi:hypothetical protein
MLGSDPMAGRHRLVIHFIVAALDVDDDDLANILVSLQNLTQMLLIDLLAAASDLFVAEPGMGHGVASASADTVGRLSSYYTARRVSCDGGVNRLVAAELRGLILGALARMIGVPLRRR